MSLYQSLKSSSLLTKSIYKLISVLETNKEGEYKKISLKGDEEIEYFAQKYNEMIDRISNFTHELEDKVNERTEELKRISETDNLTGVYNRNKLNEIVIDKQNFHEKNNSSYAVIIMDIDDFKKINDTYGHAIGDEILKQFASVLKENTRETDFLGRWGGEEFIIICSNLDKTQALNKAESLRKKIEQTIFIENLKITSSFGVSRYYKGISYEELFVLADKALYIAKKSGKNRVVFE